VKVSVFIPIVHVAPEIIPMTKKCIAHVKTCTSLPFELILIENGEKHFIDSTDKYIYTKDKKSYAENANICIGAATDSDYVVSLGNDLFCPPNWLEGLVEVFEKEPMCGIATMNSTEFNIPYCDQIREDWFGGIFMMKRRLIEKVGWWDEGFINSFEDSDYWLRTYMAGYRIYKNMRYCITHLCGQTWKHMPEHNDNFLANRKRFK